MKFSKSGLKINNKKSEKDELLSHQLFMQTSLIYQYSAGIYGKHGLLTKAQRKIEIIIRRILEKHDCVEMELPTLQPQELWAQSGRLEVFKESGQMFYCDMNNGSFCLSPTAEEAVSVFVQERIKSIKYLPITFYQINQKYRNELRSRGGLLRTKEFSMMDAYSFHIDEIDLSKEYENIKNAYMEIFSELSLPVIPVLADNGEMGGKKSEEFMVICPFGEDTILVNKERSIGINTELLENPEYKNILEEKYNLSADNLEKVSCIEVGHIFQLGTFYSEKMNIYIQNSLNESQPFYMGCYGIGITRLLATLCELNMDEKGLIFPETICPVSTQIIYTEDNFEVANKLCDMFDLHDISYLQDDRHDVSFGRKIKDWQLLGTPYAIIIGKNHKENQFELENRRTGEKLILSVNELVEKFKKIS
ncbi:aminoacyl--tRNA ligase-related protein [Aerococcus viridans]